MKGDRRFETQHFPIDRVWERELIGVQAKTVKRTAASLRVANYRVADQFAVNAKLISTSGNRF